MKISPILPIPIMIIICLFLLFLIINTQNKTQKIIRISIICLLFLINLRFMIPNGTVSVYKTNYDIIFVIDNTISMMAEDYNGNNKRMDAVRNDVKYIMNYLPSSNYSLITFDSKSYIRMPLTADKDTITVVLDTINAKKSYYSAGSNLTIFKKDLEQILKSSAKKNNHKRIVFLISDGENTSNSKLESLTSLKKLIDDGAVLGYGTLKGGYMKENNFDDEYEYIEDRSGDYPYPKAVSKIDETNLKKFASELGVEYIHMERQSNINTHLNKILNKSVLEEDGEEENYEDLYYIFAFIIVFLILLEIYYDKKVYLC